jgi:hypothetical protein
LYRPTRRDWNCKKQSRPLAHPDHRIGMANEVFRNLSTRTTVGEQLHVPQEDRIVSQDNALRGATSWHAAEPECPA